MTNDEKAGELNESDKHQNADSEKERDPNSAQQMRGRINEIEHIQKRRREERENYSI